MNISMNFKGKLSSITKENNSLLCVGLDIDKEKVPKFLFKTSKTPLLDFNKSIIDSTKDIVCSYKLNMAFYESMGEKGYVLLEKTIRYIPKNVVIILDGKRNDIGNTAHKYAQALFETLKADATTINPYLGYDSIEPFLEYKDKCNFILCRTSNPSANDLQDLLIQKTPLYLCVAQNIKKWNKNDNCGLVAGATYPKDIKKIREIVGGEIPFLIPGIGKQGGDLQKSVKYGTNKEGENAIIVSSRSIIYAGKDKDFTQKSRKKALFLKNEINKYR